MFSCFASSSAAAAAAAAAFFSSVFLAPSEGVNSSGMDDASTKRDGDMMVSSARSESRIFSEVFNEGLNFFEKNGT